MKSVKTLLEVKTIKIMKSYKLEYIIKFTPKQIPETVCRSPQVPSQTSFHPDGFLTILAGSPPTSSTSALTLTRSTTITSGSNRMKRTKI
jgi:hypothetical protein